MKTGSTGAKFYKADLHVHTGASKDVQGNTPEDIVRFAGKAQIEVLAITDHNTADWVDRVRDASRQSPVTVIPGVEITTPEGHVVALFEWCDNTPSKIADLLIKVGIPRAQHGREEAISTLHAEAVIREIADAGGIAIAAHANENNGLLKTKGQYKLQIVPMSELAALELTKQGEIERFCDGRVSADYPPKACTHSSDAHTLNEIGCRVTYLEMDHISLNGIRQALLDYKVRVRFPWNQRETKHARIISLSVNQGFFGGQTFPLHESLNCLVGGKGTGKSTVIELLRYCFADVSEFDSIREDHLGKIAALVGDGGCVIVQYLDSDGELKTVRREVQPWDVDPDIRDSSGNVAAIETRPAFFSQGELVRIAASPIAQLDLIDGRLDLTKENEAETGVTEAMRRNAGNLVALQRRIFTLRTELESPETGKSITVAQCKKLEQQLRDPVLKEFPLWEAEQRYLERILQALSSLPEAIDKTLEQLDLEPFRERPPKDTPNMGELESIGEIAEELEAAKKTMKEWFSATVEELKERVQLTSKKLARGFLTKKAEHDRILEQLGQADVRKANAQFRNLSKRVEDLEKYEAELIKLKRKIMSLQVERQTLLQQLKRVRNERWRKRRDRALEYQARLEGVIRIKVVEGGDRTEFAQRVKELSRRGYLKEPEIRQIAGALEPDALISCVLNNRIDEIAEHARITAEVARRLVEAFSDKEPIELYELEAVPLPDRPEITYVVAPGREKQLRELSTGQKGTVIIALAMIEGSGPLVIDHPEEPLDTQSIYGQVVQTLRNSKQERQFILTTHNANIAVGADAELSHILDASADRGSIQSSGAVDDEVTNRLLLLHLEGGPDALKLRIQKYQM